MDRDLLNLIKPYPAEVHKNSRGRVMVFAGSRQYPGAGALSAIAALRSGSGRVELFTPQIPYGALPHALIVSLRRPDKDDFARFDAVSAGSGWGNDKTQLLPAALKHAQRLVLDADGLNALAEMPELVKMLPQCTVLTPHRGEAERLRSAFGISGGLPDEKLAAELAGVTRAVVILKGPGSIIASPGGRRAVNPSGNANLATAGSGDVLSGMAAAFLSQDYPPFEAARLAAYLHGLAGELGGRGLIADDLPELLCKVWKNAGF